MPTSRRAKVLLLIPHLGGGGAEHVAELLAQFLSQEKYEVHLGVVTRSHRDLADSGALGIVHELQTSRIRRSPLKLLRLIWRLQPDVILSGMAHLNLMVLLLRLALPSGTRILVRQNGELSATLADGERRALSRLLYRAAYRQADLVICQSDSMAQDIQRELDVEKTNLVVLPNPVDLSQIRRSYSCHGDKWKGAGPHILAIGRLVPEKGFDLLLEAFSGLLSQYAAAELIIAGAGRSESTLKLQSKVLGIQNHVRFFGHVPNPARLAHGASIFVLSSRSEGLPNALLEAAAAGLPIVATPGSPGLTRLLKGKDGVWLANDISASALQTALVAALGAINPGQRYPHSWIEPFDITCAIPAYERVIDRAILERTH